MSVAMTERTTSNGTFFSRHSSVVDYPIGKLRGNSDIDEDNVACEQCVYVRILRA